MTYFTPEFLKFLQGLSENNTKEWFDKNRKTYERKVKEPFKLFVGEMIQRINQYDPDVKIEPKDAIFRINRDTRFSKDKRPYKTSVSANISPYGKKDKAFPGFYFELATEAVSVIGGAYMIDKETLAKIRELIASNPLSFRAQLESDGFSEKFGQLQGEQHKRLPADLKELAQSEPLIANKQFFYKAEISPKLITSSKLPDVLMEYYLAGKEVNDFLKKAWV